MRAWQTSLAVGLAGLLCGLVLWRFGIDVALQAWWHDNHVVWVEKAARVVSDIGLGRNQIIVLMVAGWWLARRHGAKPDWRVVAGVFVQIGLWLRGRAAWCRAWRPLPRSARVMWFGVAVFLVTGVANIALKLAIGRPRPKEWLWNGFDPYARLPLADAGFMSFPSGHTASTAAIATVLALAFPRWRGALVLVVVAVAAARVLTVTTHYVGDVVAGAAFGFAVAYALWHWMEGKGRA